MGALEDGLKPRENIGLDTMYKRRVKPVARVIHASFTLGNMTNVVLTATGHYRRD